MSFDSPTINRVLGLSDNDINEYRKLFRIPYYTKILQKVAISNYNWKTKKDGELFEIARGTLTEEAKAWFYFMNSRLLPSKHVSTLLLCVILRNYKFDVGNIIQQSLLEEDTRKSLIHPTLIT